MPLAVASMLAKKKRKKAQKYINPISGSLNAGMLAKKSNLKVDARNLYHHVDFLCHQF